MAFALLLGASFAGCIGPQDEPGTETASGPGSPGDATGASDGNASGGEPEDPSGMEPVATLGTNASSAGGEVPGHVALDGSRDLLFATAGETGLQVVDVSDPREPSLVGALSSVHGHDVDLLRQGNRTLAVISTFDEGIHVVDATDPGRLERVATADRYSADNLAAVPGTSYVYVGVWTRPTDPFIAVLDLSAPSDPSWTRVPIPDRVGGHPTTTDGCHAFDVRPDLGLATCAGGGSGTTSGETFLLDISQDPADPSFVAAVDNPAIQLHHSALLGPQGDLLFVGDENFQRPNCNGAGPARQPTGGVWIYDVSDPQDPQRQGYVQVEDPTVHDNCTSHFGALAGPDHVVWSWYDGGTVLVDVSDPTAPSVEDRVPPEGDAVDVAVHDGYALSSNRDVIQVLRLEG